MPTNGSNRGTDRGLHGRVCSLTYEQLGSGVTFFAAA